MYINLLYRSQKSVHIHISKCPAEINSILCVVKNRIVYQSNILSIHMQNEVKSL